MQLVNCQWGAAQSGDRLSDGQVFSSRQDDFTRIKLEATRVMKENRKLESGYELTRQDFLAIKNLVEEKRKDVEALNKQISKISRNMKLDEGADLSEIQQELSRLDEEVQWKESMTEKLSGELMDNEGAARLRKLRLAEFQNRQRELEIVHKWKKFVYEENEQKYSKELVSLKGDIKGNLEKEKEYLTMIKELEDEISALPKDTYEAQHKNITIKRKQLHLDNEIKFKKKGNDLLRQRKSLRDHSADGEIEQLKKLRAQLEDSLVLLKQEYERISHDVQVSYASKKEQSELMKKLVRIDKENQSLRKEIAELSSELKNSDSKLTHR